MTEVVLLQHLVYAGLASLQEYLALHVITCLVPAFFLAGAIAALFSKQSILRYFGAGAKKTVAYPVAALSGCLLAVCSCTALPLFGGIYKRGAGIGPATAFLFSAPAINVLAIVYTAQILGLDLGVARALTAVGLSAVIGLILAFVFERGKEREEPAMMMDGDGEELRNIGLFALLLAILIGGGADLATVYKAPLLIGMTGVTAAYGLYNYTREELWDWMRETWELVRMIVPLLLIGVFLAGIVVEVLPREVITAYLGANTIWSNGLASVSGALMYFATLTEVPIISALMKLGMGRGPALAMLLAGPALSLPNMIVIGRIMGAKRTTAYIGLVVIISTLVGLLFGMIISGGIL